MSFRFLDLFASTRSFIDFVTPVSIGVLPVLLHIADKGMEKFTPIREEVLQELMKQDAREVVKQIGESAHGEFGAIKTYFDFERKCHFVIALTVFNMLSVYVAQTQCTGDLLKATPITLVELPILAIFLMLFLLRIANRTFRVAAVDAAANWVKMAYLAFAGVMVTDVGLHFFCEGPLREREVWGWSSGSRIGRRFFGY
jgi:hypothetical protein